MTKPPQNLSSATPVRIGLFGLGKAGKEVANQLLGDTSISLQWIIRRHIEEPQSQHYQGIPVYSLDTTDLGQLMELSRVDFIVDFSSAESCIAYTEKAVANKTGIISAVSTYQYQHLQSLKNAGKQTIVLHSPNITLGINFIILAGKILRKLAPHAGVEIIEEHFHNKPEVSGTAIRMAELLGLDPVKQVNSIRVGGIVGRHEVIFGFPYQTIRLIHDSISRAAFGQGVLFAIQNLLGRPAGFYSMEQLVAEKFSDVLSV